MRRRKTKGKGRRDVLPLPLALWECPDGSGRAADVQTRMVGVRTAYAGAAPSSTKLVLTGGSFFPSSSSGGGILGAVDSEHPATDSAASMHKDSRILRMADTSSGLGAARTPGSR